MIKERECLVTVVLEPKAFCLIKLKDDNVGWIVLGYVTYGNFVILGDYVSCSTERVGVTELVERPLFLETQRTWALASISGESGTASGKAISSLFDLQNWASGIHLLFITTATHHPLYLERPTTNDISNTCSKMPVVVKVISTIFQVERTLNWHSESNLQRSDDY